MTRLTMFLRVLVILGALASIVSRPAVSYAQFGPTAPAGIAINENSMLRYAFTAISLLFI